MPTDGVVIDDGLLLASLMGRRPSALFGRPLMTTTCWWFRLGRAVKRRGGGQHDQVLAGEDENVRRLVADQIDRLRGIRLPAPARVVPTATALAAEYGLNLLAAEGIATAHVYGFGVRVARGADGRPLRDACRELGISYEVVAVT